MTRSADIGSKRLISLAPTAWLRWLLNDDTVEALALLAADFQWVGRETDILLRARSPVHGEFLVVNEMQLRPDPAMPRRLTAYTALARERYALPVYPVVVNILSGPGAAPLPARFESEFLGLIARQDFHQVNLWELDARPILQAPLLPLLPFVPIMQGGSEADSLERALQLLRADPDLAEMETLLAFFASFVFPTELIRRIMRWDMAVLRESPWYQEIFSEGLEQGLEKGLQQGLQQGLEKGRTEALRKTLVGILRHRFGDVPDDLIIALDQLSAEQLGDLVNPALDVRSLTEFYALIREGSDYH
jgi:predicted transposase YdaD